MPSIHAVGLVAGEEEKVPELRVLVNSLGDCHVLFEAKGLERLGDALCDQPVELLVVDLGRDLHSRLLHISSLQADFSGLRVLAIIPEDDSSTILQCMRAGCAQVVVRPVDPEDFRLAVRRILFAERAPSAAAKTVGFMGSVGGSGATSIAGNIALYCAANSGRQVVIAETDLHWGDLSTFFDFQPRHGLAELLDYQGALDPIVVGQALHRLPSGLAVLPGCGGEHRNLECAGHERMVEVVRVLRRLADVLIVDLPPRLCPGQAQVVGLLGELVIVTQLGVPALRNTRALIEKIMELGLHPEEIHVLVNRLGSNRDLSLSEAEKVLGRKVLATVANDFAAFSESMNLGKPLHLLGGRSPAQRDLEKLAKKLFDLEGEQRAARPDKAPGKVRSRLRRWLSFAPRSFRNADLAAAG